MITRRLRWINLVRVPASIASRCDDVGLDSRPSSLRSAAFLTCSGQGQPACDGGTLTASLRPVGQRLHAVGRLPPMAYLRRDAGRRLGP